MTYKYLKYNHLEILRLLARFKNYDKYNALDKLYIYDNKEAVLKEIEDALRRGYSLGYVDGISHTQGRPQSSSSEYAIKNHIEQIKELYNL
jgi:hypothetical protein